MLGSWFFALAAVIAGLAILFAFKRLLRGLQYRIERNEFHPNGIQKDQMHYFVQIALIEAIPIFLLILGFMHLESPSPTISEALVPFMLVIGTIIYTVFSIWMTKKDRLDQLKNITKEQKSYFTTIMMIGYVTTLGIPIISFVGILLLF
ncbi:hypothetical protein [Saliterribacillus persicus]|uniref:Uncharacterized protein n=1 Tax=Saliterribacillus persicus TaxID=930114 RepID=A0A368Y0W9_9BACI|nr:hypothetical protein [Saliterribacillus persicus]RCW73036.1 hypothetical protein DFR57_10430 [Saliterribacillus persicus]